MKTDLEMKKTIQTALDAGTEGAMVRPSLERLIMQNINRTDPAKKQIRYVPILAAALVLMLSSVAVAEMLGVNIFAIFGKNNARYQALAPQAILETVSVIEVDSPALGNTKAAINSAYYDGESLLVAYAIENGTRMETFTPGADMLASMTAASMEDTPFWLAQNEEEAAMMAAWRSAVEKGEAMGVVHYTIDASDHTLTDDGIDLTPESETQREGENGVMYRIREYATPLTEAAAGRERLDISIGLIQSASYLYFDGNAFYTRYENERIEPMRATIWKTDAEICSFAGHGAFEKTEMMVQATASAASARLQISFPDRALPVLPEDSWYEFYLTDESGNKLRSQGGFDGGLKETELFFDGTGAVPESLKLYVYVCKEGESVDWQALRPILELTKK